MKSRPNYKTLAVQLRNYLRAISKRRKSSLYLETEDGISVHLGEVKKISFEKEERLW